MSAKRFVQIPVLLVALSLAAPLCAQTAAETEEDQAVGGAINYVFATDLGSGVYDMGGRTLQVYRFTYKHDMREADANQYGVRFILPVTAGFFDFQPFDVVTSGPPTRVDSLSIVPGAELDFPIRNDWHVVPYVRVGFSVASSSVDGVLYGAGVRLERHGTWNGWDQFLREELAYAGVDYRNDLAGDQFIRLRHGADIRRGLGWKLRGREVDLGLYCIFDFVADPPSVPVAAGKEAPIQAEFGFTVGTRPPFKIWKWDAPRLGVGYRLAGELSAWRFSIGVPF